MSDVAALPETDAAAPHSEGGVRHVTPIDYYFLRQAAEWAAGMPGRTLRFHFEGNTLTWTEGEEAGADAVPVPSLSEGRSGAIRYIDFQAGGADEPVDALAHAADAAFWSESAVEKFVFPYYASCAASGVPRYADQLPVAGSLFLQDLQRAWNAPRDGVQPFALFHAGQADAGAELGIDRSLRVVFVDQRVAPATIRVLPLDEFLAGTTTRTGPVTLTEIPPSPFTPGDLSDPARLPSARELRVIAEWACSVRGERAYFRYDVETGAILGPEPTEPPVPGKEIVIPTFMPFALPGRLAADGVWIQPEGAEAPPALDIRARFDALFWSTGAIEKFLFPYYASKYGFEALSTLTDMREAWTRPIDGVEVYALGHLPKSLEESLEVPAPVGTDVGVVHRVGGATHVTHVREFARRYLGR